MKDRPMVYTFIALLLALLVLCVIGWRGWWNPYRDARVEQVPVVQQQPQQTGGTTTLFVVVHGLDNGLHYPSIVGALKPNGDVLPLRYPNGYLSNAEPQNLADSIARAVSLAYRPDRHQHIVLVGQSMGALLVRRALLDAETGQAAWARAVTRVVLLAGMNRGWDISGKKPSDMSATTWLAMWAGTWFGRLTDTGRLIRSAEAGAVFVADLRLDWMRRFQKPQARPIEVVQLLGDIDDIVGEDDNKDLLSMASRRFAWLRVRGTGHLGISDFEDTMHFGAVQETLGDYRKRKFLLAVTARFEAVMAENEEQPFQPDHEVRQLVFVLHGIRDLGEWAFAFERDLKCEHDRRRLPGKIAIASIRYGYFGMGPFVLQPGRQKYVKWLMDEYTETLARYPNVEQIHFVAHSNGTYLFASALEQYHAMKVDRVVFGGSVVQRGYHWNRRFKDGQLGYLRNYVAADDWVVALLPRFFEPKPVFELLHNDIGSGGFNGFDEEPKGLENVRYVVGGHSAFLERIREISQMLLAEKIETLHDIPQPSTDQPRAWLKWLSDWGVWFLWLLAAVVLVFVGWRVTASATTPAWPFLLLFLTLVLAILKVA
jgi:alpha-beta hydrolase superfamily lysophospholipase